MPLTRPAGNWCRRGNVHPPRPRGSSALPLNTTRNGVSNLFMLFAPLEGWRRVEVTDRLTRTDWAEVVPETGG